LVFLSSFEIFAFEPVSLKASQITSNFEQVIQLNQGEFIRIHGLYSFNAQGEKQVHIYLKESHILSFETEQLVIIGKDINDDSLIDTWFFQNESGSISFLQRALTNDSDFQTMKEVFAGIFDSEGRWTVSILMKYAFQNLTLTGSDEYQFWANYENRQIELLDMELRLGSLLKKFPNDPTLNSFKKINADCWLALFDEFAKHKGADRFKMVGADVGLYLAGGVVVKGVGFVGKFVINKIGLDKTINFLSKMGEEHYQKLKMRVTNTKNYANFQMPVTVDIKKSAGYGILVRLAEIPLLNRPAVIIEDLVLKNRLTQSIVRNYPYFLKGLAEVNANKGYISYITAIQLGAEMLARGYVSYSDVPIILDSPVKGVGDIAKKVGSDKDLLQNLGYMSVETANAAGISKILELKGASLTKRFLICGIASTIDSIFMAKVIKGEINPIRNISDTAWEVVIGNSQTLFDIWQWQKWKELATTTDIKQLKVVGVLITFVHQAAGYYYYSKWSDYLEKTYPTINAEKKDSKSTDKLTPVLVPVLAPQN
jgi:hypothetical protein